MRPSSLRLLLWSFSYCVGLASSFQHHQSDHFVANPTLAFRRKLSTADPTSKNHHQPTCLHFTRQWNAKYDELAEFYKEHGHLQVESHRVSLHNWMAYQRARRKGTINGAASLTEEEIRLLDKLNFQWQPKRGCNTEKNAKHWMSKYQELAEFYKEHGHLRVEYQGSLYRWMRYQRSRRSGDIDFSSRLTEEEIRLLDKLDFQWEPKKGPNVEKRAEVWMRKYQELADFYKEHGHFRVEYQGSLYRWMSNQRNKRRGTNTLFTPLTEEQIRLLDDLDFQWNPRKKSA